MRAPCCIATSRVECDAAPCGSPNGSGSAQLLRLRPVPGVRHEMLWGVRRLQASTKPRRIAITDWWIIRTIDIRVTTQIAIAKTLPRVVHKRPTSRGRSDDVLSVGVDDCDAADFTRAQG